MDANTAFKHVNAWERTRTLEKAAFIEEAEGTTYRKWSKRAKTHVLRFEKAGRAFTRRQLCVS